jgi:hypothetical protein
VKVTIAYGVGSPGKSFATDDRGCNPSSKLIWTHLVLPFSSTRKGKLHRHFSQYIHQQTSINKMPRGRWDGLFVQPLCGYSRFQQQPKAMGHLPISPSTVNWITLLPSPRSNSKDSNRLTCVNALPGISVNCATETLTAYPRLIPAPAHAPTQ